MVGKPHPPLLDAELPTVEPHVLGAGLAHPPQHRLGHDVARREVRQLVLAGHERDAAIVDQDRPLAPHRLADQRLLPSGSAAEPGDGRVELHELQIAYDRSSPQSRRHAVAGGDAGLVVAV